MKKTQLRGLEKQYRDYAALADAFRSELVEQLQALLIENSIFLGCPIESRVKTWESIADKIDRRRLKLSNIEEIDDLVGARLTLIFKRDVEKACGIVSNHFNVLAVEDTRDRLGDNQFGYSSKHYKIEIPKAWLDVPTLKRMSKMRAELQVRTLSQHIWATASHVLQYKQEVSVPAPLRRTIHRVSALLETVDLEFERVLEEKDRYKEGLAAERTAEALNVDSLAKALDSLWPQANKSGTHDEAYSSILGDLLHFKVDDTEKLKQLVLKHSDAVLEQDRQWAKETTAQHRGRNDRLMERWKRGVYFTHVGLTRQVLRLEHGEEFEKYQEKMRAEWKQATQKQLDASKRGPA